MDPIEPNQKRFKEFLLSMNFHDMGAYYVRGDFVIEGSSSQNEIIIEELRVGPSAIAEGALDAFLDMLLYASNQWGLPIRIRAKGVLKEELTQWGFRENRNSFNMLRYEPNSTALPNDGASVKAVTLVFLSGLVLALLIFNFFLAQDS
jgi:hypothetical protein